MGRKGWDDPRVPWNPNYVPHILLATETRLALVKLMADRNWNLRKTINWLINEKLIDLAYLRRKPSPREEEERAKQSARQQNLILAVKNWPTMNEGARAWWLSHYPELQDLLAEAAKVTVEESWP